MIRKTSWSLTRRTLMKSSLAGAMLAGYKLLWPSVAQAGPPPTTGSRSDLKVIHNRETDPFGVAGLGEGGRRKSRLGFELCPGRGNPSNEG